mgnify:CR=1 FL=1
MGYASSFITDREPVDVLVKFTRGQVQPIQFKKNHRSYPIQAVHLVHSERKGRDKITYFSASDGANVYRLAFFSESCHWFLEQTDML